VKEGRTGQERACQRSVGGGDVEWTHRNASIIDKGHSDYDCSVSLLPAPLRKPSDDTRAQQPQGGRMWAEWIVTVAGHDTVLRKVLLLASFHIHAHAPPAPEPIWEE
jgi:hypothetical protein